MTTQSEWLAEISDDKQREQARAILNWVSETFPQLKFAIKWNQPVFTDHGTYILGLSASTKHISVAPEEQAVTKFIDRIEEAGYTHTHQLFRITTHQPIDYDLLKDVINFNIEDKQGVTSFWR